MARLDGTGQWVNIFSAGRDGKIQLGRFSRRDGTVQYNGLFLATGRDGTVKTNGLACHSRWDGRYVFPSAERDGKVLRITFSRRDRTVRTVFRDGTVQRNGSLAETGRDGRRKNRRRDGTARFFLVDVDRRLASIAVLYSGGVVLFGMVQQTACVPQLFFPAAGSAGLYVKSFPHRWLRGRKPSRGR